MRGRLLAADAESWREARTAAASAPAGRQVLLVLLACAYALTSYVLFALLTRDGNDSPLATDGAIYLKLCSEQLMALQPSAQVQPAKE